MLRILVLLLMALPFSSAQAEAPPIPQSKAKVVGSIEQQLKQRKTDKKKLEKEVKTIETQLGKTRDRLVKVARSVQTNEKELQNLEGTIDALEHEQRSIQNSLGEDRSKIASLILALERIERVPPEALLARPEAPYKTAQSALLMGNIIPALHEHAESLKQKLEDLDRISEKLEQDRRKALETADSLHEEHTKLSGLVGRREKLFEQTNQNYKEREKEVQKISAQAKNLQDLVEKLEKDRKRQQQARTASAAKPIKRAYKTPVPKPGQPQLPISGMIRTSYDEPDTFGAPSKGLEIEGRSGAIVVAPMGGVVRFTGPFKRYGQLIILEHTNGYHSLIAGLKKIDTVVGHSVSAGEPLGSLQNKSGGSPSLYYELRLNGKPVNPARKFANLS
ncbi:MAG: membrane protein [Micavibrio sp.]|nr:MAG: membrane protein [Micavibrio sp.]